MEEQEIILDIPIEHERNIFGGLDCFVKKIEKALQVNVILRDGSVKIMGEQGKIREAEHVFEELIALSKRGNTITEQNVDYLLSLQRDHMDVSMIELDKDLIGFTVQGKPINRTT